MSNGQATSSPGAGAYAVWSVAATFVGLATDLLQPLGAFAFIVFFIFAAATLLTGAMALMPSMRAPMGAAAMFSLLGAVVFGAIVALQYAGSDTTRAERGFVAASVPALATLQEQVLKPVTEQASTQPIAEPPIVEASAPQDNTPLPQIEAGVVRNGAFAARVERLGLDWRPDRNYFYVSAGAAISLHNRGTTPVSVAILHDPGPTVVLDSGYTMGTAGDGISIYSCARTRCRIGSLTRIEPGSSTSMNIHFNRQADGSGSAWLVDNRFSVLQSAAMASISARLLVVPDGAVPEGVEYVPETGPTRVVQLGFANVPITKAATSPQQ